MGFTHLHLHTEYSLLDGAARIEKVVSKAKEFGMTSLAITDHGTMYGVVDFWRECKKNAIHPVIGCEVYVAPRSRFSKEAGQDNRVTHLILLAKDNEGYKNLMKIVTSSFIEGFYYKPRVDKELLRKYSKGIICLSACLIGEVQKKLLYDDYAGAREAALEYIDIYGRENFYIEIQNQGLEDEYKIIPQQIKLAEELGVEMVATNDVHYVTREDAQAHDILLCIQTGKTIDDQDRMKFANDEFYLKSEAEMREIFAKIPEACDNTEIIANRCTVDMEFGNLHLPEFTPPDGMSSIEYLRYLAEKGLKEKYSKIDNIHTDRLEHELKIIEQMGYVEYFLIVWDFINYARQNDIVVGPGRGSAAGSIVSYSLGITNIDPIKYNLIFERFLNPERISMPDIDIDFCYERRGEVIDYVIKKYGKDKVAQIVTFGTMKARSAIKDVGRVLNISYAETDRIAKMITEEIGMTIDKALSSNQKLLQLYTENPQVQKLIDAAKSIEGAPRHTSIHAAGVVITKDRIDEYVPLCMSDKGISTQFPMTTIEELGLLKMDFLGLRNLTVIRDTLQAIKENYSLDIDFSDMEYNDSKVYEEIAKGNTQGVFQLESDGMTQFMKNLCPDCFEDIIAGISLYRPGPMDSISTYIKNKNCPKDIKFLHPMLKPILGVTYGCLVYQEQVMQIVRQLAGYSYGRSDILRRAMGKKKKDVMLKEKEGFITGCRENGVDLNIAEKIFADMVSFAEYAFNKSHAAAYAVLAYQTAYLKTYYPAEFMAALMTSVIGDNTKIAKYIRNCKEMGIEVLPPDINESQKIFTATEGKVRFGLLAIKNVGAALIDEIIKTRQELKHPFRTIYDFLNEVDSLKINKKALESMIRAGALDSLDGNRAQHLSVHEEALALVHNERKKASNGQMNISDFFDENEKEALDEKLPDCRDFNDDEISKMEKEFLGVYLTKHPLNNYEKNIEKYTNISSEQIIKYCEKKDEENAGIGGYVKYSLQDGQNVKIAGIITTKKNITTKKGDQMCFIEIEDLCGHVEIIVFPKIYDLYKNNLHEEAIVLIEGRLDIKDGDTVSILASSIQPLPDNQHAFSENILKIRIDDLESQEILLNEILNLISNNEGDSIVLIYLPSGKILRPQGGRGVCVDDDLIGNIEKLVGRDNVKFI